MKKIVVLGYAPLFYENTRVAYSGTFRTWNIIQFLLNNNFKVLAICMRLTGAFDSNYPPLTKYENENLIYYSIDELKYFRNLTFLKKLIKNFSPQAIIGVNTFPAYQAVNLDLGIPVWADLNGYVMTEAQSKAFLTGDNSWIEFFWKYEKEILKKADIFSVASEPQKYTLVGELATIKRLNKENYSKDFIYTFPNSIDPDFVNNQIKNSQNKIPSMLKKLKGLKLLWAGSFTTWVDEKNLAKGLKIAIEKDENIHLVITGGEVKGHDEITIQNFKKYIKEYKLHNHVHFTGWIDLNELTPFLLYSDFGICIDDKGWETFIGARYRITNMIAFGLPVITTKGTEISKFIENYEMGYTVELNNPYHLAKTILQAKTQKKIWLNKKKYIKEKAFELFSYNKILAPLKKWLNNPNISDDKKNVGLMIDESDLINIPSKKLFKILLKKLKYKVLKNVSRKTKKIHNS